MFVRHAGPAPEGDRHADAPLRLPQQPGHEQCQQQPHHSDPGAVPLLAVGQQVLAATVCCPGRCPPAFTCAVSLSVSPPPPSVPNLNSDLFDLQPAFIPTVQSTPSISTANSAWGGTHPPSHSRTHTSRGEAPPPAFPLCSVTHSSAPTPQ